MSTTDYMSLGIYTDENGTTWNTSGPTYHACYPPSDRRTVCHELLTAFVKKCKREARAVQDRQILRGIARLQSFQAHDAIRERRRFVVEPKRVGRVRGRRLA